MSEALWVTGDTLSTLRALPDGCVDLVMTSPPFLALRSYLPSDDPAKVHEIGQEATPGAFLDVLLDITEECARVLAPHGTLVVELGDTYSGSGGAGGDYAGEGLREGQPKFGGSALASRRFAQRGRDLDGWPLAKSLALIPESYRWALAYGRNPHTGRTTDPWRVRNVVRWCRPNPPVGALGDKFRPGTSDLVVACKSGKRWFDLDAVRTAHSEPGAARQHGGRKSVGGGDNEPGDSSGQNPAGAPPLDWWEISTQPYKGSHYAAFPEALVVRPVKAMCPLEVCRTCGEPRRRITDVEYVGGERGFSSDNGTGRGGHQGIPQATRNASTLGWTDCGHDDYRPGRVLDPFGGSGTTLAVATGHGRDALGIDLDVRNADLARERIGPMFFTELTADELADRLGESPNVCSPAATMDPTTEASRVPASTGPGSEPSTCVEDR